MGLLQIKSHHSTLFDWDPKILGIGIRQVRKKFNGKREKNLITKDGLRLAAAEVAWVQAAVAHSVLLA